MDRLLKYMNSRSFELIEDDISHLKVSGLHFDNTVILDTNLVTNSEITCVLAEEIGHLETSHGDILDLKKTKNLKQEKRACNWGYEKLVKLDYLIDAYKYGCSNRYETAEYLEVTEEFLEDAVQHFKEKYGLYQKVGKYIVYFEPLGVLEKFE